MLSVLGNNAFSMSKEESKNRNYWLNVGYGIGGIGLTSDLSLSLTKENYFLNFTWLNSKNSLDVFRSPMETADDVSLQLGYVFRNKISKILLSSGVSQVTGVKKGNLISQVFFHSDYEKISYKTIGIPTSLIVLFPLSPSFSLGIRLYANINREKPYSCYLLGIQIGKFE